MSDIPPAAPAVAPVASENPPQTPPAAPPPPADPPPASRIVVEGTKTEREIELERRLEEESNGRRKAETDASYHADEARRLKELQSQPPKPAKQKRIGVGFWEIEED